MQMGLFGDIPSSDAQRGADLSECGLYRYALWRSWDNTLSRVGFLLLNPSTADHTKDDPTLKRLIGFAQRWGYGGLYVLNLFAYRTPSPHVLQTVTGVDVVGPRNDEYLLSWRERASLWVAGWGNHGGYLSRDQEVLDLLGHPELWCLRRTKEGHPTHPLYQRGDSTLTVFNSRAIVES